MKTGSSQNSGISFVPGVAAIVGPDLSLVNPTGIIRRWNKVGKPALENPAASAMFKSLLLFWTSQLGFRQAIRATLNLLTWGNKCGGASTSCFKVWQLMLAKIKRAQQLAELECFLSACPAFKRRGSESHEGAGSSSQTILTDAETVDASGKPVFMPGEKQNVSQQDLARVARIEDSEARLRKIIDTIPALAWCNLSDGSKTLLPAMV